MECLAFKSPRSNPIRFILAAGVSCLTLYLAFRQVDIRDIQQSLFQADWRFVGLALLSVLANNWVKILRWQVLLEAGTIRPDRRLISMSFFVAQMFNAVFPVRAGELSRIYVLGREGNEHAFVLGTIAVEKILDLAAYSLLAASLILLIPLPGWFSGSALYFLPLSGFLCLALAFIIFQRNWIDRQVQNLPLHLPSAVQAKIQFHFRTGLASLNVFDNPLHLFWLALVTVLCWGTAILTNWLIFEAMHIDVPAIAALFILVVLQAGISFPSLPGKIGIFEYLCILSLAIFGIEQPAGLSFGFMLHLIVYLPIFALGILSFWKLQLRLS